MDTNLIEDFVTSIEERRSSWPTLTGKINVVDVPLPGNCGSPINLSHLTGLTKQAEYAFAGDNQTKNTRWPQGVSDYWHEDGERIITSFYFTSSSNSQNTKFVVIDPELEEWIDVVPAVLDSNGKFVHLHSHAGGLAIIGDYLYVADSNGDGIRVFSLADVYPVVANASAIASGEAFLTLYDYFMPEVGRIHLDAPGDANISYLSVSQDGEKLVAGNFYSTTTSGYAKGGAAFIWIMPLATIQTAEFPHPVYDAEQFEPLFPAGPNEGTTITRIQGVLLLDDNTLVISRSYASDSKQLIVMNPDSGEYFSGIASNPLGYNPNNWLFRCEDLSISLRDPTKFLTVTEDPGDRSVTEWSISEAKDLMV